MVRRICSHCAVSYVPQAEDAEVVRDLGLDPGKELKKGEGCYFCSFTGYRGRMGIFEILVATEAVKSRVLKNAGAEEVLTEARKDGFITMKEDGARKVGRGLTSPSEIVRSVYIA
jgi:type II secretory ATPase GspE/PulE/Tfp pilus assembly ATPase PilB-like protein